MSSGSYIFKELVDGIKYVGDFNGFYANENNPWGQMDFQNNTDKRMLLVRVIDKLPHNNILDVGCGLGHITYILKMLFTEQVTGADISVEAIGRAKHLFPDVNFIQFDIRDDKVPLKFDVIIFNHILWYILPDLKKAIDNAFEMLSKNGHIVFTHHFLKDQKYGKDIIDGYFGFIRWLCKNGYFITHSQLLPDQESIVVLQRGSSE